MARIAKQPLPHIQLESLFTQLHEILGKSSTTQIESFMYEFLGREERIMLAKRLAIIVMLTHGSSLYKVAQTLSISSATAGKIQDRIEQGHYSHLIPLLKKNKKQYLSILKTLDSLLHLGGFLPHYTGMERYRNIK